MQEGARVSFLKFMSFMADFVDDRKSRDAGYVFEENLGPVPRYNFAPYYDSKNLSYFSLKSPGSDDWLRLTVEECEKILAKKERNERTENDSVALGGQTDK